MASMAAASLANGGGGNRGPHHCQLCSGGWCRHHNPIIGINGGGKDTIATAPIDCRFHQRQLLLPPLTTAIASAKQSSVNGSGGLCQQGQQWQGQTRARADESTSADGSNGKGKSQGQGKGEGKGEISAGSKGARMARARVASGMATRAARAGREARAAREGGPGQGQTRDEGTTKGKEYDTLSAAWLCYYTNSSGYKKTVSGDTDDCRFTTLVNSTLTAPLIGLPPKGPSFATL